MVTANLQIKGAERIVKGMKNASAQMSNMKSANLAAAIEYEKWIKENFLAKGGLHDNGSLKWKALKESTVKAKEKIGRNASDILIGRTRNLMLRWVITANNSYGKIRSNVKYSSVHEYGASKRGVPRRKIFPTEKQGNKITKPVYAWFVKKATRIK